MMTTPFFLSTNVFTIDAKNDKIIEFDVIGGDTVEKNELSVENQSTGLVAYTNTTTSRIFEAKIPANSLQNNNSYRYRLRTIGADGSTSNWTQYAVFSCYTTPTINLNITHNQIVRSSSLTVVGTYSQAENSPLFSNMFNLYDINNNLVNTSGNLRTNIIKNADNTYTFTYTFLGLKDNTQYKIEPIVQATNGLVYTGNKITFSVEYEQNVFNAVLTLENLHDQGKIKATTDIIAISGKVVNGTGTPTYENGEIIDTTNGCQILYSEAFSLDGDFTLKLDAKMIVKNKDFLMLYGKDDTNSLNKRIVLSYYNNRIHVHKINGKNDYYIYSDIITFDDITTKLIWMKQENNLLEIRV